MVHVVWNEQGNGNNFHESIGPQSQCPPADHALRVVLRNDSMMEAHELRVRVASTAAGSASEYLLDCYRPLFDDLSLRRPSYQEAQRRLSSNKNGNA